MLHLWEGQGCTPAALQAQASLRDIVQDPLFRRFAPLLSACSGTGLAK